MYKVFEIQNYIDGTIKGAVTLEDGFWSADTEIAQNILKGVQRRYQNEEDKIKYLSTYTNQQVASRLVVDE